MTQALIEIGCWLAAAAGIIYLAARNSIKEIRISRLRDEIDSMRLEDMKTELDIMDSAITPAQVEHIGGDVLPYYHVYRMGGDTKFTVRKFYYDPKDPDDRDYKRIHAEEVAEKINERP